MKRTHPILILVFLIVFVITNANQAATSMSDSQNAPGFSLKDLKGNEISLSDYKGKVVFLNFWAIWCPPCRQEIPGFVEVYNQYKDKGMEIIGISLDKKNPKKMQRFMDKYKINYPVVFGTQEVIMDYKPGQFIPVTIIIDQKGKIRHKHIGFLDKGSLKDYFVRLIKEK
jgi:cytochrome c biogenesis protein CcmG/thiol:disulfide interchange protein DsbE